MANDYEKVSEHVNVSGFGFDKTVTVENKETGDRREVTVWRGSEDYENRQIGEQIAKGKK